MAVVFPYVLKTSKVVSVFQNDSILNCSNYRQISLLLNIEKILNKLMKRYSRLWSF